MDRRQSGKEFSEFLGAKLRAMMGKRRSMDNSIKSRITGEVAEILMRFGCEFDLKPIIFH
jgi:hypothetical protein